MQKVKVTWLGVDGMSRTEIKEYDPDREQHFSDAVGYDELTAYIGGPAEYVALGPDSMFYCHEEGKVEGLPFNAAGTVLFSAIHGFVDPIAGNIVVCEAVR